MAAPDASSAGARAATPRPATRREQLRERTRREIKDAALRQITELGGAGGLSLNAVAKSLGMAGPSLYRYFDSRDTLLTELLVDGFDALAAAVETAVAHEVDLSAAPDRVLVACARAYRSWALDNAELYELVLGTPVPGYAAPMEATGPPAARAMLTMIRAVDALHRASPLPAVPGGSAPNQRWQEILDDTGLSPRAFTTSLGLWARVHGLITLELRGHLGEMVPDPAVLYESVVATDVAALVAGTAGPGS